MKEKLTLSRFFLLISTYLFLSSTLHAELRTFANDILLKGEFVQGGIVIGQAPVGSQIVYDKQNILISSDGHFVIGFNRDESHMVNLQITTPDGKTLSNDIQVKKREYKIQSINGLPESKVSPVKSEVLARIKREGKQVSLARKRNDHRLDYLEDFIWPATGSISGVYGSQRVLNGKPKRPHFGVDVAASTGADVVAPASGIITLAAPDMFYSGGTIILDHGHGLSSTFLHLSKLLVKTGQAVKKGELIAKVGATGRATGPHLDWRMNLFKRRVDPQLLVPTVSEIKMGQHK